MASPAIGGTAVDGVAHVMWRVVAGARALGVSAVDAGAEADWDLLSSYAGLLALAVLSIYTGAHGSLPRAKRSKGAEGEKKGEEEEEDDEDAEDMERMSSDDAWLFPIVGSVALVGLYMIVKYLGEKWINWLLGWYFSVAGVGSVWNSSISLTRYLAGEDRWKKYDKVKISVKKGTHVIVAASIRWPSIVLLPLALVPTGLYALLGSARKSVLLTDVLALSFAHNALSLLKIDSFKTGCILLSGLFVYDVWWVFGTDVMVKVATSLDVPIKLLWPKSVVFAGERGYTMLGLGDVVIPGTFIGLALRYDVARGKGTPYFYACLGGYVVGLVLTMMVMHVFGKAQPALLYLSPACILSFVVTALVRGELEGGWKWEDGPDRGKKVE